MVNRLFNNSGNLVLYQTYVLGQCGRGQYKQPRAKRYFPIKFSEIVQFSKWVKTP